MQTLPAAVAAIAILVALSGCVMPMPVKSDVLVLEYTLTALGEGDRAAEPGHHCGTARIDGDTLHVQRWNYDEAKGSDRILYVDSELKGAWATIGDEPFVMGLPAKVDARIYDDPGHFALIDADDGGVVRVNGNPVSLPHEWSVIDRADGWRIDATLSEGPDQVVVERDQLCA